MVIPDLKGGYPPYFVFGPLVFSTASAQFVSALGGNAGVMNLLSVLGSPLITRRGDQPAFSGEELVIVSSPFFTHRLSKNYSSPAGRVVDTINGIHIRNLAHLVEVLRDSRDEFVTIEFCGREAEAPVFPRKEMLAATEDILTDNGVRSQGSAEMLAIWNAKPSK
jgi:hypothetical protein